jgi:type III restriction enzyme
MAEFEVPEAIICSPFDEPSHHWRLAEGEEPRKEPGRRPASYFFPEPVAEREAGVAAPRGTAVDLALVNLVRGRVKDWRESSYTGVTATTLELLRYWRRDGRSFRFFSRSSKPPRPSSS